MIVQVYYHSPSLSVDQSFSDGLLAKVSNFDFWKGFDLKKLLLNAEICLVLIKHRFDNYNLKRVIPNHLI